MFGPSQSVASEYIVKMADVEMLVELYGGDLLLYLNPTYHCVFVSHEASMFIFSEGPALAVVQHYTAHICGIYSSFGVWGDFPLGEEALNLADLHLVMLAVDSPTAQIVALRWQNASATSNFGDHLHRPARRDVRQLVWPYLDISGICRMGLQ